MSAFKPFSALCLAALLLAMVPMRAAEAVATRYEAWGSAEVQLTLSPETDPNLAWHDVIPDRLRVYSELQFASDFGLQQSLVRVGPIWNLLPWLTVASHVTTAALPSSNGYFNQEVRLELEPTIRGSFSPDLRWTNRHRVEYRMRPDRQFWRYRTRFALNYHIPDSAFTPFVSNEVHFEPGGAGFNQNRILLGVSYQLTPSTQLSLSYLNRYLIRANEWVPEHGLMLSLFYSSREDGLFQMQAD